MALSNLLSPSSALLLLQQNSSFVIVLLLTASFYALISYLNSPWRRLPPGPPRLPMIGNYHRIPDNRWLIFTEWKKTYGDIIYLNMFGQSFLVLNSHKVATDLLDRRVGIYSDRPSYIVASDFMCSGLFLFLAKYSDAWRRMRKASSEILRKSAMPDFHHKQTKEALLLASGMLAQPQRWRANFERAAASLIMSVIYDTPTLASEHNPSVKRIVDVTVRLGRSVRPGAHLVEFFKFLLYIPDSCARWKRDAKNWFIRDSQMFEELFNGVRTNLAKGEARPSVCATLITEQDRHNLSKREGAWLAASLYSAGADTTASVLSWWLLAMLAYPETQKRAQAELDAVIGRSRPPTFADMDSLPYTRAMINEVHRWRPIGPLGFPHLSTEDDWYEGYFIPAGTICFANIWCLNLDPDVYGPDAGQFNPARHLDARAHTASGSSETREENHAAYGFGRRICVGRHLANNSLFIDIATILWAMNIERATDENGNELPLDVDGQIEDGLIVRPIPFELKVTPRFPEVVSILEQAKELLA
ncbi:hypothetical protein EW146_g6057 [Bondarzewia mesenterica]|uniref:Cytochrome P450 n=1 Tax=Bondarzewia mesenterica TaxID=1095465 RepID=A0A4S4LPN1_9AGAM|nr:hypothetical protein EW146_g6057 [Bondarzewia mesenterica]